jgi:putative hydrolase of the HAD superfamily
VLFDLDDCLVDSEEARRRASECVSARLEDWGVSTQRFWAAYSAVEPRLFSQFARGEIAAAEYRDRRFRLSATTSGCALTERQARELNVVYMAEANGQVRAFPEARDVLQRLRAAGVRVGVLTNGPSDGQRQKLAVSGLADLVERSFISEEIGVGKPAHRAFRIALAGLDARSAHTAMVGDSFTTDIAPAIEVGMRAVLVGHQAAPSTVDRVAGIADVPRALGLG